MANLPHRLRTPRPQAATPSDEPIRIVIAEGQGLVRGALRVLLDHQDGMVVTAGSATTEEAVAAACETRPDVVLMDFDLPGCGGIDATSQILTDARPGTTRVVMLLASESDKAVFGALRAGATGLLLKDTDAGELVAAVRAAADGDVLLAPALARSVVADFLARPERLRATPEQLEELTAREREVMALVALGMSNEEIAERLVVTRATAKTHVSRALCKLHARDRAQLVVLAYEAGLVRPGALRAESTDNERASVTTIGRPRMGGAALRPVAA
jgi:DNA-binding NarL/FixJ family response regulator